MSNSLFTKPRIPRWIIAVVLAVLLVGATTAAIAVNRHQTQVQTASQQASQEKADAKQAAIYEKMDAAAAKAVTDARAADEAAYQQYLADQKAAAEAKAAADAKAEADAAAKAAVDAAAKQSAKAPAKKAAGGVPASGQPSGTPLPMKLDTDPNSGQFGEMIIAADPGSWCASHSGSTINGVPTCD